MRANTLLGWLVASRKRVVVVTFGVLLMLDLGRSAYARIGYATPVEPWQAAPYEAMAWPPGADLAADTPLGERIYIERCALCHGPQGRGDGPAAPSMIPRPRDFRLGLFKYKSTPAGQPPTDEDLARVIRDGLQASAMPYWGDLLSETEIGAVIDHVKGLSPAVAGLPPQAIDIPPRPPAEAAGLASGADLFAQHCAACHGADGRAMATFPDQKGYPVRARDLTAPWTFRGGSQPEDIWLRVTSGLAPSPMPSFADILTPNQRWDVVNYVLSIARTPAWESGGVLAGPGQAVDPRRRGEYLLHLEMCGLCHTQINPEMVYSGDTYYLAGGMGIPAYPQGIFVSRNLTPDPKTGLGNWTVAQVADAIRNGRGRGRYLNLWGMPWMFLHSFEPEDAEAIATYLKSRPPVTNRVPPPLKYGFVESIIGKALYSTSVPPIGNPRSLIYKAGNYGDTTPGMLSRDWPQRVLMGLQWLTLATGAVAFVAATPAGRRRPRGGRGCLGAGLLGLGMLVGCLLLWVMYSTPVLPFVPPGQINQAVMSGIPHPDPAQLGGPEEAALAARGEYLFKVTSCAFCHGAQGAGGAKINMATFGTLWARNITSDRETGLGAWSDAEIARAMRSGVSRAGRPLHWQGMTWDHFSNMDEEDVRAIIVYLRTLPPIQNQIPDPAPPSADDCAEYTFFLVESLTPGCAP